MNNRNYFKDSHPPWLLNTVQEGDGLELLKGLKDQIAQLVIFDPQYKDFKKARIATKDKFFKHQWTIYHKLELAN